MEHLLPQEVGDTARHLAVRDGTIVIMEHHPRGLAGGVVVICPSLFREQISNQRRERMLASSLAARGVRCLRLQPRGCGNAIDGSAGVPTVESMQEDVEAVIADAAGEGPVRLVGFRMSALIAMRIRQHRPDAHVVLWEPSSSGSEYLSQSTRAYLLARLRSADHAKASDLELHGDPLLPTTRESLLAAYLPAEIAAGERVSIVGSNRDHKLPAAIDGLVQGWRLSGVEVDVSVVPSRAWWIQPDQAIAAEDNPDAGAITQRLTELLAPPSTVRQGVA